MKRLLVAMAVLVLLAFTWGFGFENGLRNRMERKANRIFYWASERGAHVCVRISVDGADPDGEYFSIVYLVCQ